MKQFLLSSLSGARWWVAAISLTFAPAAFGQSLALTFGPPLALTFGPPLALTFGPFLASLLCEMVKLVLVSL